MDKAKIVALENDPPDIVLYRPRTVLCREVKYFWSRPVSTYGTGTELPTRYIRIMRSVKRILFLISSVFHAFRIVLNTLHHLCLSTCRFNLCLSGLGESISFDRQLLGYFTVPKNLNSVLAGRENA